MSGFREIRSHLAEHVGKADLRLFDALLEHLPPDAEPGQPVVTFDKAPVLESLRVAEGKTVSNEVVRARVRKLKVACEAIGKTVYGIEDGFLDIASRKAHFVLTWSDGAEALLERKATRRAVAKAAQADNVLSEDETVEPRLALPTHTVMVSHGWEDDAVEAILDEFVDKLNRKLTHLPEQFRSRMAVRLWFDRKHMTSRADFDDQTDPVCQDATFAVFMTSDKWFVSEPCRREYAHFDKRPLLGGVKPFVLVQLSGNPTDQDASFRNQPCLPQHWNRRFETLLTLWEKGDQDDKDRFVTYLRDEICSYLEDSGGGDFDPEPTGPQKPGKKGKPSAPPRLREIISEGGIIERDLPEDKAIETGFLTGRDNPDELEEAGETIEALPFLEEWATNPAAEHRVLAIVGGFGMGKTVTVQRLADRLYRKGSGPTPVYLDFRRLIPAAEAGKPLWVDLPDIIHTAIGAAAKPVSPEKLVALIQAEPCVVIFDGLDEVGNRIGRDHAAALYRQLLELVPRTAWQADMKNEKCPDWSVSPTRIVVTCRTHFFRSLAEEQGTFTLGDRSTRQIRTSLRTLHMAPLDLDAIKTLFIKSLGEDAGTIAFETIKTVHDLPGLSRRPILARYIGDIAGELLLRHQSGEVINIATVYEELFNRALERDSEKIPILTVSDRVDVLKALALHLHRESAADLGVAALEKWFDGFALDHSGIALAIKGQGFGARSLLQTELRNASFLVRVRDDRFVFAHTSFYEYFLGLSLFDAVLARDVSGFESKLISDETIAFCFAAAQQSHREASIDEALHNIIVSSATASCRAFVWRLLTENTDGSVPALPANANLSELKLRDLHLAPGTVWDGVQLFRTVLTGLDARGTLFRNVSFDHAFVGNSCFERCRFLGCTGDPIAAESARIWQCNSDDSSNAVFASSRFHWPRGVAQCGTSPRVNQGPGRKVLSVAFSPDGKKLLTGSADGTAKLWDKESGAEISSFPGNGSRVRGVAFSPDGATLLTGGSNGKTKLWDIETNQAIQCFEGHAGAVRGVAFFPDCTTLLTGGSDGTARIWNKETGQEICAIECHVAAVTCVAISPDGSMFLTGSQDGTARLWDLGTSAEIHRFKGHGKLVYSVAFAPDGATLLIGGFHGAKIWDRDSGVVIHRLKGHDGPVRGVAFSPDGKTLLTGSHDRTARLWCKETGAEVGRLYGHSDRVTSVAFAPDGATLVTGSHDGTARLWSKETSAEIHRYHSHCVRVASVSFGPDNKLVTGGEEGTATIWDKETGGVIQSFKGHSGVVTSLALAPDGATLLTGASDGIARLWDTDSGALVRRFSGHGVRVTSVAFSPDGNTLITGGSNGIAKLRDKDTGAITRSFMALNSPICSIAFAPDGLTLLTGHKNGGARLWDKEKGTVIHRFRGLGVGLTHVAFSPDNATLLTCNDNGIARLWDKKTGREICSFQGQGIQATSVAIAPDDGSLLTGESNGDVRIWDKEFGTVICSLNCHAGAVTAAAFAPDGATLFTVGSDGKAKVWDRQTGALIFAILPLPESWIVVSPDEEIIRHGPNLWRYAHAYGKLGAGLPKVVAPSEAALLERQCEIGG